MEDFQEQEDQVPEETDEEVAEVTDEEVVEESPYQHLFALVSKTGGQSRSKLFDQLLADEKKDLLEFVEWLGTTSMTQNSVNSYKSYVIKMMLKARGVLTEAPTNDEKSGGRKFEAWHASKNAKKS